MDTDMHDQTSITLAPKVQATILSSMLRNTKSTDVSLFGKSPSSGRSGGETLQPIRAHKLILATGSEFFSTLFAKNGFADSDQDEYTLDELSHESLKLIVEVLYTGKVSDKRIVTEVELACGMLQSFKYLLMNDLALACGNIIIKHHLTVDNCIFLWGIACKYSDLSKLNTEVETFIAMSLPELMLNEGFLYMESNEICRMMLIESVKVSTSADLRFRAAFVWLDYDFAVERRTFSDDILATIPLTPGKISRDSLKKACCSNNLTEAAMKKVLYLLACSLDVADIDFLVEPDYMPRTSSGTINNSRCGQTDVKYIFCVGGKATTHENDCLQYDVVKKKWQSEVKVSRRPPLGHGTACGDERAAVFSVQISGGPFVAARSATPQRRPPADFHLWWQYLKPLPWKRYGSGACVFDERILIFGGNVDGKPSSIFAEYNTFRKEPTWEIHQDLKLPSTWTNYLACSVRDTIYVACSAKKELLQCTPPAGAWKVNSCMASMRYGASVVYSQAFDAIYVAGGGNCPGHVSERETQIEKFNVNTSTWQTVGFASSKRVHLGAALQGENLFLVGGADAGKSAESFNIRTGKTFKVPDMLCERKSCQAAVLYNNVICVFGGGQKSVEAFDVREGKWTTGVVVPDMPYENSMFSLAWK